MLSRYLRHSFSQPNKTVTQKATNDQTKCFNVCGQREILMDILKRVACVRPNGNHVKINGFLIAEQYDCIERLISIVNRTSNMPETDRPLTLYSRINS